MALIFEGHIAGKHPLMEVIPVSSKVSLTRNILVMAMMTAVIFPSIIPAPVGGVVFNHITKDQFTGSADNFGTFNGTAMDSNAVVLNTTTKTWYQATWRGGPDQDGWDRSDMFQSSTNIDFDLTNGSSLIRGTWEVKGDGPLALKDHATVYAPTIGRMYVFGGELADKNLSADVLIYNPVNDAWTKNTPTGTVDVDYPSGRKWHAACYDSDHDQIILTGGRKVGNKGSNETWIYKPSTGQWRRGADVGVTDAGVKGEAIWSHTTVWDTKNHMMLVFGGFALGAGSAALWAYNPELDDWIERAGAPEVLYDHRAVFDAENGTMYVLGGRMSGGEVASVFLAYDAITNTWKRLPSIPDGRSKHGMALDDVNQQILVFAGFGATSELNDTWIYSKVTEEWHISVPMPMTAKSAFTAVLEPVNQNIIIFAGGGSTTYRAETNVYDPFYNHEGTLISSAFSLEKAIGLSNVSWDAVLPSGVGDQPVRVQISLTMNKDNAEFTGPKGASTYYTKADGSEPIPTSTGKYLRYKFILRTAAHAVAPTLKSISVNYEVYPASGAYISPILDGGGLGGRLVGLTYNEDNPGYVTSVNISVRSANDPNMTKPSTWESVQKSASTFSTPQGRFFQYMLILSSQDASKTPRVTGVTLTVNFAPVLTHLGIDPPGGTPSTTFHIKVLYQDADGDAPSDSNIYFDETRYDMNSDSSDYVVGVEYTWEGTLVKGDHQIYYEFSDGSTTVKLPRDDSYDLAVSDKPTAAFTVDPSTPEPNKVVEFDASTSKDDSRVAEYYFDFGDGTNSTWLGTPKVPHRYSVSGTYKVRLLVKDDDGLTSDELVKNVKVEKKKETTPGADAATLIIAMVAAIGVASAMSRPRRRHGQGQP